MRAQWCPHGHAQVDKPAQPKNNTKRTKKLELTCKTLFLLKMQDSRTVHEKAIRAPPRNSKHYFTEGRADKHKQT